MSGPTSPAAAPCFEALSEAAEGFDNVILLEAISTLLAQVISSGSFSAHSAQTMARKVGVAMAEDIGRNWSIVVAQRKAKNH